MLRQQTLLPSAVFAGLENIDRIADNDPVLVGITLTGELGTKLCMTQCNAEVFRRAGLHHVTQGNVAFPFLLVAVGRLDVRTAFIHGQEVQPGNAKPGEVIAVTDLPGAFSSALELADR